MDLSSSQISLCEEIASAIRAFLSNPKYSLRYIQEKTGVSKSYISRLQHCEVQEENLDILKVYLILKTVLGAGESKEFLLKSSLKDKFVKYVAIPFNILDSSKLIDKDEVIFSSKETFITFTMAANKGGTSVEKLYRAIGEKCLAAVEKLKAHDIISVKEGEINISDHYLGGMRSVGLTSTQCKKALPYFADFYRPQNKQSGKNVIFSMSQNVNEEFLRESRVKLIKTINEIFEGTKDPKNKGDLPFFLAGAMDTFIECVEDSGSYAKKSLDQSGVMQ